MHNAILIQSFEYRQRPFLGKDTPSVIEYRNGRKRKHPMLNPFEMPDEERLGLLREVRAGEVLRLSFFARVFGDRPNSHLLRPVPGNLNELVRSSKLRPFQRDHRLDTDHKIGEIFKGVKETASDGVDELFQELDIVDPVGMEKFLLQMIREFSIQIGFEEAFCSKCSTAAWIGWFGAYLECDCVLGKSFKHPETGKFGPVEIFTTGNQLIETSWVTLGAYPDTQIMSAFSRANREGGQLFGFDPVNQVKSKHFVRSSMTGTCAAFGDTLAAALNGAIDEMVTDDKTRQSIVDDMASAAGIESSTVNQILNGSINCPPLERLESFAGVLDGVSSDDLVSAAEDDGCTYGDSDDDDASESSGDSDNSTGDADGTAENNQEPGMATNAAENDKTESELTPEQENAQLKAQLHAMEDRQFEDAFGAAVSAFKVPPAHREVEYKMFNACERNVAEYSERFKTVPSNPAYAQTGTGTNGSSSPSSAPTNSVMRNGRKLSPELARIAVKVGFAKPRSFKRVFGVDPGVKANNPLDRLFGGQA